MKTQDWGVGQTKELPKVLSAAKVLFEGQHIYVSTKIENKQWHKIWNPIFSSV